MSHLLKIYCPQILKINIFATPMSQQFRITLNQQDHFFKILEPTTISRDTDEIIIEVNQDQVVKLKKEEGAWKKLNPDFPNFNLIDEIMRTITLRFRL